MTHVRTLQPILFGTKEATEKTPVCAGYFSVTLKRKGTVLACRLSYLVVEKTTAFVSSWRSKGMCRCK